MRPLSSVSLFALALALTLACAGDDPDVRVATEGTSFALGGTGTVAQADVPFTVANRGDRTVFVPTCGERVSTAVERGVDGRWEQYSGGFCILTSTQVPREIRPGERATGTANFLEAGHYRIRLSYGPDVSPSRSKTTVSRPFDVR